MWEQPVSLICYLIVAVIVIFVSLKLSDYVDLLDKKTKLSGAFLGGILLAAVTSLPELFTSITATTLVQNNKLVLGNILGSNLFNICLFTIIYAFFFRKFINAKVNKIHLFTLIMTALMYASVTIASFVFSFNNILWGWFNPMSIAIVIIYAISVLKTPKEEEAEDKETDSKLTVKQIVILFIIFSILLIGASIGITYLTDWVVKSFNMGSTFGGALFLGVATSIPELVSTINLSKKKNINAAYGNIIGSCCFNFIILSFADLLSFNCKENVYSIDQSSFLLIILGSFSLIILAITFVKKIFFNNDFKTSNRLFYLLCSILLVGSYITFLVLSNIDLHIDFAPFIQA